MVVSTTMTTQGPDGASVEVMGLRSGWSSVAQWRREFHNVLGCKGCIHRKSCAVRLLHLCSGIKRRCLRRAAATGKCKTTQIKCLIHAALFITRYCTLDVTVRTTGVGTCRSQDHPLCVISLAQPPNLQTKCPRGGQKKQRCHDQP